jgi:hypothetical protein
MDTLGVGSHQQILLEAIKRSGNKPILELGAGDYSTRQIHEWGKGRSILTIETNQKWAERYKDLRSEEHLIEVLRWYEQNLFFKTDTTQWGVVFIDSITWEDRLPAIKKYKDTADYLVIHDTGYSAQVGVFGKVIDGRRDFSEWFKYWVEYLPLPNIPEDPPTVLGSNLIPIKPKQIEKTVIVNYSK